MSKMFNMGEHSLTSLSMSNIFDNAISGNDLAFEPPVHDLRLAIIGKM